MNLLFHPATLFVLFNIGLAATAMYCWNRYQDKILDPGSTLLSAERIEVNDPPVWAKTNLKEAILTSTGEPKSLLDPELIADTVATCQSIGWIEQIRAMEKTRDGLKVELIYREPVAAVELKRENVAGWDKDASLIPVDRNGVIMPESLAMHGPLQPKIYIFHSDEDRNGPPRHLRNIYQWTAWPDERVKDAAAISGVLANDWQSLGLSRVISYRMLRESSDQTIPYELWTEKGANNAIVVWGNAPGAELETEANWINKLAALQAYVQKNGPLNKLSERVIDLRSGQAIQVGKASALGYRRGFETR